LLFRSFRALIASIVPNVLPILAILSFMVVLHIPLDPATVMIATIAIGISADDTIHFLSRYKLHRGKGLNPSDASGAALGEMGRAAFFTSVVAAAGFSILALSEFPPMACFGLLTALTMLMALLGDIFILPAMCNLVGLWRKKR
jgi:predicted RND superfamily exporter protein